MNVRGFVLLPASLLIAIIGTFLIVPNAIALFAFKGDAFLQGEVWRVLTYPFVHVGPQHLAENVVALLVSSLLAFEVEMTPAQYAVVFGSSLFVVALADLIFFPSLLLAGASAAILAVYGGFAMKGSMFISRGWLVVILGATVWTKTLVAFLTQSLTAELTAQTLLHFLGFAAGVGFMIICLQMSKTTRVRVFS